MACNDKKLLDALNAILAAIQSPAPPTPPAPITLATTRVRLTGPGTYTVPSSRTWAYTVVAVGGTLPTVGGAQRSAGESFGGDSLSHGNQVVLYPPIPIVLQSGTVIDFEWTV